MEWYYIALIVAAVIITLIIIGKIAPGVVVVFKVLFFPVTAIIAILKFIIKKE